MGKRVVAPKPEEKKSEGATNPRVADKVNESGPGSVQQGPRKQYGKHATMPVLAADQYAEVILPDLTEFNPEDIKLDGTIVACGKRRTGKSWVFRNLMYRLPLRCLAVRSSCCPYGRVWHATDACRRRESAVCYLTC